MGPSKFIPENIYSIIKCNGYELFSKDSSDTHIGPCTIIESAQGKVIALKGLTYPDNLIEPIFFNDSSLILKEISNCSLISHFKPIKPELLVVNKHALVDTRDGYETTTLRYPNGELFLTIPLACNLIETLNWTYVIEKTFDTEPTKVDKHLRVNNPVFFTHYPANLGIIPD